MVKVNFIFHLFPCLFIHSLTKPFMSPGRCLVHTPRAPTLLGIVLGVGTVRQVAGRQNKEVPANVLVQEQGSGGLTREKEPEPRPVREQPNKESTCTPAFHNGGEGKLSLPPQPEKDMPNVEVHISSLSHPHFLLKTQHHIITELS
jgi:hypothetical protein